MSDDARDLVLLAPLPGWCSPLDEVPDDVFAGRMMGDGLAIDPTDGTLLAPCDGELVAIPQTSHAVTLRAANGAEILLHVGIDTVGLSGAGFEMLVRRAQRVSAGEPLIRFDLDSVARRAKSLVTPVIVTEPDRFAIVTRHATGPLRAGDQLMTIRTIDSQSTGGSAASEAAGVTQTIVVALPHGLHARPAAVIAHGFRDLQADVVLSLRDRSANARSAVSIMALGAGRGDRLTMRATGIDAAMAFGQLERSLAQAMRMAARPAAPASESPRAGSTIPGTLAGIRAAPGLALGQAARLARAEPVVTEIGAGASQELERLNAARERLRCRLSRLARSEGGARAEILGAHLEFLDDPELLGCAHAGIAAGKSAGYAWRSAVRNAVRPLESLADPHLAARVDDLRDLELQLLDLLDGPAGSQDAKLPDRAILVAQDLLPSQLLSLDASRIAGICTISRAATSHVAILAAAMDIPMLAGVDAAVLAIADGTPLLLDAEIGSLAIDPAAGVIADAERRIARRAVARSELRAAALEPCRTADGKPVRVFANIASTVEAATAVELGAEGCGLLRTEFLFLDRLDPPDVGEQRRNYQEIANAFAGRPVVFRTLDAGGDKPMAFLALPSEDNPALGLRGIRASLWRPELLRAQIEAILGVRPAGSCRILLPMINDVGEIQAVRRIIDEVCSVGEIHAAVSLGIMIETPAAAIDAARLAEHADFFSIGTNDLAQYVLAIDRTHPLLASNLDALHPAVLRLIGDVCAAASRAGRPVAICGGLASDPAAAPMLAGLGAGELSAVPAVIPAIKQALRRHTLAHCRELAGRALALDSALAVRELLDRTESGMAT
jgi:phosphocarrier protein FPr/phosphocarrier protein